MRIRSLIDSKSYTMEEIKSFIADIKAGKFKVHLRQKGKMGGNRAHSFEKMSADPRFRAFEDWLQEYYHVKGMGIKSLIKKFDLPFTYSVFRTILIVTKHQMHSDTVANDWLKECRKNKVKKEMADGTGWFGDSVIRSHVHKGKQGKYFNKSRQKFVHLRSSYEYIYAKWLDSIGADWDIEVKGFKLKSGSWYKPDFFIYENGILVKIVEVKGWKDERFDKVQLLREELPDIEIVTVLGDEIKAYTETPKETIAEWKAMALQQDQSRSNA